MRGRSGLANGWPLVGWAALALGLMVAAVLGAAGGGEGGIRMLVRATARSSLALFLAAFCASSLRQLWHSEVSAWLLRNRRQLGVSFAVSHFLHLGALVALGVLHPHPFLDETSAVTFVFGGLAYLFIAAMTATSFDRSAAWLGRTSWKRLHSVGMYYLWFIFFQSYGPRAIVSPGYAPLALALVAALGLRAGVRLRARRPVALA